VVGVPDPKWGEAVSAAVVLVEGQELAEEEFIAFCRANMARYKVPKMVKFVDQLPQNVMGKVLKYEVRKFFD
jgi:long-chain acyl-CoA synthetase